MVDPRGTSVLESVFRTISHPRVFYGNTPNKSEVGDVYIIYVSGMGHYPDLETPSTSIGTDTVI